jgi:hypothetical protein
MATPAPAASVHAQAIGTGTAGGLGLGGYKRGMMAVISPTSKISPDHLQAKLESNAVLAKSGQKV